MLQDVYIEECVHRETTKSTRILNGAMIGLTTAVAVEFILVDYRFFGIPLMAMLVATYFVTQNTKVDFDYVLTNGLIEITKISRKRKRKDLLECEMRQVVVIAKSKTEPVQRYIGSSMKTFDCTSHKADQVYYTMIVREDKTGVETKFLFEPSDEMLQAMKRISPDKVYI